MIEQTPLQQLVKLEQELHRIETLNNRERLDLLLHAEFEEIGYSSRRYNKADLMQMNTAKFGSDVICAQGFVLTDIGQDVALLTYKSADKSPDGTISRYSLRSSIWLRTKIGWQMRFHQGTPTTAFDLVQN